MIILRLLMWFGLYLLGISHAIGADINESVWERTMARMLYNAEKIEEQMAKSNQLYQDETMIKYLEGILEKLYPKFYDMMKVRIILSTELNAFVLTNGTIYFNLGLLAAAENEAQIASILAHEGAHVVSGHTLRSQQDTKFIAQDQATFGYRVDDSLEILSLYSIDLEMDADEEGFKRLLAVGYDPNEAANIFNRIKESIEALGIEKSSMFKTHPDLLNRAKRFKEEHRGTTGIVEAKPYLQRTAKLRLLNYQLELSKYQYKTVLLALQDDNKIDAYTPEAWFYLGEAYRLRNEKGDLNKAKDAYIMAVKKAPAFSASYRALGLLDYKGNQLKQASKNFEKYLNLSPTAADSAYIKQYLQNINNTRIEQ